MERGLAGAHLDAPTEREPAESGARVCDPQQRCLLQGPGLGGDTWRTADSAAPHRGALRSAGLRPAAGRAGTCVFEPAVTSTSSRLLRLTEPRSGARGSATRSAADGSRILRVGNPRSCALVRVSRCARSATIFDMNA